MHENITSEKIEENIQYWKTQERDAKFVEDKKRVNECVRQRTNWEQIKFEKEVSKR